MDAFPARAGGVSVIGLPSTGSTNDEALARWREGETAPLWVAAVRQTAGRGRRGRPWVSEPGNLHASLLLPDPAPPAKVSGLCFVAGLALHDAVLDSAHGLPRARLALKWPNDLLLNGKKLGGILVEGASLPDRHAAVVGFGVNCARHPAGTEFPATDLAAYACAPGSLLEALGERVRARIGEWRRGENFGAIRTAWLARAHGRGAAIEVRLADRTLAGIFETVDPAGALVLKQRDGTRATIAAGEILIQSAG